MRRRTGEATRLMLVAIVAMGTALALVACGTDGAPSREAAKPPVHCSTAECPELPVYSSKRLDPSGVTSSNESTAVPAYMTNVLNDLDVVWQDWFSQLNIERTEAGRVLIAPGKDFVSKCQDGDSPKAIPSDFPNAFFCPVDTEPDGSGSEQQGAIILPEQTFADIWNGKLMGSSGIMLGDFTAATIIAHEYGHNVVYRLNQAYGMGENGFPTGDNRELIADCFAGNWAATVFERKDLSFKEMAQAAALMISVGDAKSGQGHGTSVARAMALWRGFNDNFKRQGQPGDCLQKYWPAVLQG